MSDHAVKKNGQCHDDCTACHVERLERKVERLQAVVDAARENCIHHEGNKDAVMLGDPSLRCRCVQCEAVRALDGGKDSFDVVEDEYRQHKLDGEPCPTCGGSGDLPNAREFLGEDWNKCPCCHGTGRKP
jgi:hypothetical protein